MATVICHTPDCVNNDLAIEAPHPDSEETGQPDPNWQVWCGACNNPITDIEEDNAAAT